VLGAVTVTAATGSFIYGMLNAGDAGWADLGTLLPIAAAVVLYGVFVVVERTVPTPLMHLGLLSRRPSGAVSRFAVSSRPQRAGDRPVLPARGAGHHDRSPTGQARSRRW
jgi:hypothetical protein